ncbi:MAG: hypothetical protein ACTHVM_07585 [Alkalibacterium gilvum]|uniref:hypothetical protein n=1 Tax=Alkalibacterium gilvum TaxID=1130080 RepID=UPI003F8FCC4F
MKKFLMLFATIALFFVGGEAVQGAESINDINIDDYEHEITYQDDEITVGTFGNNEEIAELLENSPTAVASYSPLNTDPFAITPFATGYGPGGVSRIDVASSDNRTIFWAVTPSTKWPYYFEGRIQLRYYSGFSRDALVTGIGAIGTSSTGYIRLNAHKGGKATLVGNAYDATFKRYAVVPNVSSAFGASR